MSFLADISKVNFATIISRILGFFRDVIIANYLGVGGASDAFFAAFRLPNLFRAIFAEGAMSSTVIPMLSKINSTQDKSFFISNIFTQLVIILILFVLLFEIAMPFTLKFFVPGIYEDGPGDMLLFASIMFPYILFISLTSFFICILQHSKSFFISSLIPVILNVSLITGALYISNFTVSVAHALSISVFVAGIIQTICGYFFVRKIGFNPCFIKPTVDSNAKSFYGSLPMAILCYSITQIGVWINTLISSFIPGLISCFYYADRLCQLPLALIGFSISVVLLPIISSKIDDKDKEEINDIQNKVIELGLLFIVPASLALFSMSEIIVRSIFFYGEFSENYILQTAEIVSVLACALPAQVMSKIFIQIFFAYGDMKVPVKTAFSSLVVMIIGNLLLVVHYGHLGVASAIVLGSWVNVFVLLFFLRKKSMYCMSKRVSNKLSFIIVASCIMLSVTALLEEVFKPFFSSIAMLRIICLMIIVLSGGLSYFASLFVMKAYRWRDIKDLM